jgi:hypothetical protein
MGVRDNLLAVFKEQISGSVASWEKFITEIKAVDIDTLRDWAKKEEANERKEKRETRPTMYSSHT